MNSKIKYILIATLVIALTIGIVYAAGTYFAVDVPQTGDSPKADPTATPAPTAAPTSTPIPTQTPTISAAYTIDGATWTNGTPINWGQLLSGANTKTFAVTNTGNTPINNIVIDSPGLNPWTETITGITLPLAPGATTTGTLTLAYDTGYLL